MKEYQARESEDASVQVTSLREAKKTILDLQTEVSDVKDISELAISNNDHILCHKQ